MSDEDFIELAHSVGVKTRTGAGAIVFGRAVEDRVRAAVLAAPVESTEDPVTVPRGLLGAACAAIEHKHDAPKTLAHLRRYTTGGLSGRTPEVSMLDRFEMSEEVDAQIEAAWQTDKAVCAHDPRPPREAFWAGALWAINATR
jgi:hypothetical protein